MCPLPRGEKCPEASSRDGSGSAAAASRQRMSLCARGAAGGIAEDAACDKTPGQWENGIGRLRAWLQHRSEDDQN